MRTLVVYYSLGGTTRRLAETLAKKLGADTAEIRCERYGRGALDFLKACYDSVMGRLPPVEAKHKPIDGYDLVLVGGPIWAGHAATPMRAYIQQQKGKFKRIAYFVTYGGSAIERALSELAQIGGQTPEATLSLRTGEVLGGTIDAPVQAFASGLTMRKAA
jgi:flavodoxin